MVDYTPDLIHEDIRDAVRTMRGVPGRVLDGARHQPRVPWEFYDAVPRAAGYLTVPEEYGGGGWA